MSASDFFYCDSVAGLVSELSLFILIMAKYFVQLCFAIRYAFTLANYRCHTLVESVRVWWSAKFDMLERNLARLCEY